MGSEGFSIDVTIYTKSSDQESDVDILYRNGYCCNNSNNADRI